MAGQTRRRRRGRRQVVRCRYVMHSCYRITPPASYGRLHVLEAATHYFRIRALPSTPDFRLWTECGGRSAELGGANAIVFEVSPFVSAFKLKILHFYVTAERAVRSRGRDSLFPASPVLLVISRVAPRARSLSFDSLWISNVKESNPSHTPR